MFLYVLLLIHHLTPTASGNQHVAAFSLVMPLSLSCRGLPDQMHAWERIAVLAKGSVPDTEYEFSFQSLAQIHCRLVMTVEVFFLWWPLGGHACWMDDPLPSPSGRLMLAHCGMCGGFQQQQCELSEKDLRVSMSWFLRARSAVCSGLGKYTLSVQRCTTDHSKTETWHR